MKQSSGVGTKVCHHRRVWGFLFRACSTAVPVAAELGLGEGSVWGMCIFKAKGPCKEAAPLSKGNFSLSAECITCYQLELWELAFRGTACFPALGEGQEERGRSSQVQATGFPWGTSDLKWGLRREGGAPGAKLGIQWVAPDGLKSKADKALAFKMIYFFFLFFLRSFILSVGTSIAL